jgi:hypothetical protein
MVVRRSQAHKMPREPQKSWGYWMVVRRSQAKTPIHALRGKQGPEQQRRHVGDASTSGDGKMPDYVTTPDYRAKFNALRDGFWGGASGRSQAPLPSPIAPPPADASGWLHVALSCARLLSNSSQDCGWRSIEPLHTTKCFCRLEANLPMHYLLKWGQDQASPRRRHNRDAPQILPPHTLA